jgi:glycosyltransferase involved in cell wall biosynthesis
VARLVSDKNLGALIVATAGAGPGAVELDLIGDGPLRAPLESLASAAGAVVRFHGARSAAQTAQAYADADALALVSHHEPFGVALREGVAAGLPLIASAAAGATGDIAVAGRNAIVVDPDDTPGIAAAVRTLAEDGARRAAMAQASREIDAEWPLQRSVDGFARAVLLAGGRERPAAA